MNTQGVGSQLALVDMVFPDQSNHHGTLFGGAAIAALDKLAFILGSKVLRGAVVTAAVNRIDFHAPVHVGYLTEAVGTVQRVGTRSITIAAELFAEDLLTGTRESCLQGEFVMVSTDGQPGLGAASEPKAVDAVCVAEIVFPSHANHRGILHGGPAMAWLAKAGFAAATRHARLPLVMASCTQVDFVAPARVGDIVEVFARPVRVGRRSLTVEVSMFAETPETGERRLCTRASAVFVVVEDDSAVIRPLDD
ncbi:hotdog domain-containing protein [Niveibacterium sp. SC-1]|uniref:acyl-CoA thioesterase n=1 Tax=Niveibacterium sp. SC-1 TaxID=3135646 RepID=UPI00311FB6F7